MMQLMLKNKLKIIQFSKRTNNSRRDSEIVLLFSMKRLLNLLESRNYSLCDKYTNLRVYSSRNLISIFFVR